MKAFGLATLGRDVEVRETAKGLVASMSLAFTYGRKGEDGKRPTQWVKATLWGDNQIDALEKYLTKGTKISVSLKDVHIATYQKQDGSEGTSLEGTVVDIELAQVAGDREQSQQAAPQQARRQAPAPAPQRAARAAPAARQAAPAGGGFDDMDDDIPF